MTTNDQAGWNIRILICGLAMLCAGGALAPARAADAAAPAGNLSLQLAMPSELPDLQRADELLHAEQAQLAMAAPLEAVDVARLEAVLASDRAAGRKRAVVRDLLALGIWGVRRGELPAAERRMREALEAARPLDDPEPRAAAQVDLGVVLALQGRHADALASLRAGLAAYREAAGQIAAPPGRAQLLADLQQRLEWVRRELGRRSVAAGIELALLNLAAVHAHLGEFGEARRTLDEARPNDTRSVLSMRAAVAARAGLPEEARSLAAQAGRARDPHARLSGWEPLELRATDQAATAQPRFQPAPPTRDFRLPTAEVLLSEEAARRAESEGRSADALAAWTRMALQAQRSGAADAQLAAMAGRQRAATALGEREFAIYLGKRAVEEIQRQRTGLAKLSRDAQRAFAAASRRVFEALADALLDADRLPEAERALLLLRQDDVAGLAGGPPAMPFTPRERAWLAREQGQQKQLGAIEVSAASQGAGAMSSTSSTGATSGRMYQGLAEGLATEPARLQEWLEAAEQRLAPNARSRAEDEEAAPAFIVRMILHEITQLPDCPGLPDAALQAARRRAQALLIRGSEGGRPPLVPPGFESPPGTDLRTPVSRRLRCLAAERESIERQALGVPPPDSAGGGPAGGLPPAVRAELGRGAAALGRQPDGSVALHFLVETWRVRVLRVAAGGWRLFDLPVTRTVLEAAVAAHLSAVQTPARPAMAAARSLHALLFEPLEPDLRQLGARTLVVAADGPLGLVPFAALHDGRGWLVERYAFAVGAALAEGLPARPAASLRVAAFGRAAAAPGFDPLPAVPGELAAVVRGADGHGLLPGQAWLDRAFTASALRGALAGRPPILHLATHFVLRNDDPGASFLLLGDGSQLTLREFGTDGYPLAGIDLVTLSACRTALDLRDGDGQAFEGMAALLRARGVASVLATLWPVEDDSTARLMADFYGQRRAAGKAVALQRAQLAMISGGAHEPGGGVRGAARVGADPAGTPGRPQAHPYYWAPFVLSGEWR